MQFWIEYWKQFLRLQLAEVVMQRFIYMILGTLSGFWLARSWERFAALSAVQLTETAKILRMSGGKHIFELELAFPINLRSWTIPWSFALSPFVTCRSWDARFSEDENLLNLASKLPVGDFSAIENLERHHFLFLLPPVLQNFKGRQHRICVAICGNIV